MLADFTAPYSNLEAWLYDTLIAPGVVIQGEPIAREIAATAPQGADLLDVGCGGGQLAVTLARWRPDLRLAGIDLSAKQVERARRRARGLDERVRFVEGSALELPFPDQSFDLVLSVAAIKHWPDRARGISECYRVLRPGGGLEIVEADPDCRPEDVEAFVRGWRVPAFARPWGARFFTQTVAARGLDTRSARELMALSPFRDVEIAPVPGAPAVRIRARRPA